MNCFIKEQRTRYCLTSYPLHRRGYCDTHTTDFAMFYRYRSMNFSAVFKACKIPLPLVEDLLTPPLSLSDYLMFQQACEMRQKKK